MFFYFLVCWKKKSTQYTASFARGEENFIANFVCCDNICLMSYVLNCWLKRETAYVHRHSALQGFQIKQMIFFFIPNVYLQCVIWQDFPLSKEIVLFLFPFLWPKLIHAGSFIFQFFLKICWKGEFKKFALITIFSLVFCAWMSMDYPLSLWFEMQEVRDE